MPGMQRLAPLLVRSAHAGSTDLHTLLLFFQAAEAEEKMAAWQQDLQQQQATIEAALSSVQAHVLSSIQSCKIRLAQLQHWLVHPTPPHQHEVLSRQLLEAEQQLVQLRREARECEIEVQRVAQLSVPPLQHNRSAQSSVSDKAGPASPASPDSNSNPRLDAAETNSAAQRSSNGTSPSSASLSRNGLETQTVGTRPGYGQATFNIVGQRAAESVPGPQGSHGRSLWQPAGGASSSTASVVPLASAVTSLPAR